MSTVDSFQKSFDFNILVVDVKKLERFGKARPPACLFALPGAAKR